MGRRDRIQAPEDAEEKQNEISYMQPEILPVQIMVDVLKERGVKSAILEQANRKQVIHLFHKYVSPKYQREYRDNRRGKIMKKSRAKREIKINEEDWKKLVVESSKGRSSLLSSLKATVTDIAGKERLKPPPACINTERKTIKLGGSSKTPTPALGSIVIKKRSSEENSLTPDSKVKKLSDEDTQPVNKKRKDADETPNNVKKSKPNHEATKESSEETSTDTDKKKERKPISWP